MTNQSNPPTQPGSVERLQELLAKATKGPWRMDAFNEVVAGDQDCSAMVVGGGDYIVAQQVPDRDWPLIVAMHEALPWLLSLAKDRQARGCDIRGEGEAKDEAASRIEQLEAALKPFADWAEEELEGAPDDMPIGAALFEGSQPKVKHLRAARTFIDKSQ